MRVWLGAVLAAAAVCGAPARAAPDTFGLGDGHSGALSVTTANRVINAYAQVTAPAASGDTSLTVSTVAGFAAGDLVLVLQTTGIVPSPVSGSATPVDLTGSPVGQWELARLDSATGTALGLSAPLVNAYAASVTQVIRVPEYTTVTVTAGASLTAPAWNGSTGGVLAFLAQGAIANDGQILATGLGFRGGTFVDDTGGTLGCSALDDPAPTGAQKGEGVDITRFGPANTGRGNVGNGGGGGDCSRSGGGGGGSAGPGGQGGFSQDATDSGRNVGGLGGSSVIWSLVDHLSLGGGGGAGHGSNGAGGSGGSGGGIVFIRGAQLSGSGSISVAGTAGGDGGVDGAGGGGAGGSLYLRLAGTAACGGLQAGGGTGGSTNAMPNHAGPGGGGGGGQILLQATSATGCSTAVGAGLGGTQPDGAIAQGASYGAQPTAANQGSSAGNVDTSLTGGFTVPAAPTVTSPVDGSVIDDQQPLFQGRAQASATVDIFLDGSDVAQTATDLLGNFGRVTPFPIGDGMHQAQLSVMYQGVWGPATTVNFIVVPFPTFSNPGSPVTTSTFPLKFTPSAPISSADVYVSNAVITLPQKFGTASFSGGVWSATGTLADGYYKAQAKITDTPGNVGPVSTRFREFDVITPPAISAPSGGAVFTTTALPLLTGTTYATNTVPAAKGRTNVAISIRVEGAVVGTVVPKPDGSWTFMLPALAEGLHRVQARVSVSSSSLDYLSPASNLDITVDDPPTTAIDSGPASVTDQATGAFTFHSNKAGTFECKLDGGAWMACATPLSLTVAAGPHTLQVRAKDQAGQVDPNPPSTSWIVEVRRVPHTFITAGPQGVTHSSTATFEFTSDVSGATFECSVDGIAWTPCATPLSLSGLASGGHHFQVRAKDSDGNVDPDPPGRDWSITHDLGYMGGGLGGCSAMGGESILAMLAVAGLLSRMTRRHRL